VLNTVFEILLGCQFYSTFEIVFFAMFPFSLANPCVIHTSLSPQVKYNFCSKQNANGKSVKFVFFTHVEAAKDIIFLRKRACVKAIEAIKKFYNRRNVQKLAIYWI